MDVKEARQLLNKTFLLTEKEKLMCLERFKSRDSQVEEVLHNYKDHKDVTLLFEDLKKYDLLTPKLPSVILP